MQIISLTIVSLLSLIMFSIRVVVWDTNFVIAVLKVFLVYNTIAHDCVQYCYAFLHLYSAVINLLIIKACEYKLWSKLMSTNSGVSILVQTLELAYEYKLWSKLVSTNSGVSL